MNNEQHEEYEEYPDQLPSYQTLIESFRFTESWRIAEVQRVLERHGATFEKLFADGLVGKESKLLFAGIRCPFCKEGIIEVYKTLKLQCSGVRYLRCRVCGVNGKSIF